MGQLTSDTSTGQSRVGLVRVHRLTEKDDDLEDNQETGNNGPEDTSGLIGDSAALNVLAVEQLLDVSRVGVQFSSLEGVDGLDVVDHIKDGRREDKDE